MNNNILPQNHRMMPNSHATQLSSSLCSAFAVILGLTSFKNSAEPHSFYGAMMKKLFLCIAFLFSVSYLSAESLLVPKVADIFTIAIQPGSGKYFTSGSLLKALPNFQQGSYSDIGFKVGEDRVWQNGVIVLKNKAVLFWATNRPSFIRVTDENDITTYWVDRANLAP
jgi:hypothetical protein